MYCAKKFMIVLQQFCFLGKYHEQNNNGNIDQKETRVKFRNGNFRKTAEKIIFESLIFETLPYLAFAPLKIFLER